MKMRSVFLCAMVLVFGVVGTTNAALIHIGTASYGGSDYNLIYEDDQGLVWLDYTRFASPWEQQVGWADGLNETGVLTYNLDPMYIVSWGDDWRLPSTDESVINLHGGSGYEGPDESGNYDYEYGYNMTNSEMGHLFYESLENLGLYDTDGSYPQPGWGLQNTGPFSELNGYVYRSGTIYSGDAVPTNAWTFNFINGHQIPAAFWYGYRAMAVRPGDVSAVPVPSALLLLGSGLVGLIGIKRKLRKG